MGLVRFPETGATLIDFRPEHIREAGAYNDATDVELFDYTSAKATGAPWPKNYKFRPFRGLKNRLPGVVLDVGCRNGEMLRYFSPKHLTIGVDISGREMFNYTPNILDSGAKCLILCDGASLPLQDASVDIALCMDVLEHLLRPEAVIRELRRVLRPGGLLAVTVPNLVHWGNRISVLAGSGVGLELAQCLKGRSPVRPISGIRFPDQHLHVRFFTMKSLAKFLHQYGFTVIDQFGYGPLVTRMRMNHILKNGALGVGAIATVSETC